MIAADLGGAGGEIVTACGQRGAASKVKTVGAAHTRTRREPSGAVDKEQSTAPVGDQCNSRKKSRGKRLFWPTAKLHRQA